MPWEIRETDGRYCVHKQGESESLQCYDSPDDAEAYLRALYASEHGRSVKSLGDGRIGGYGVIWGSPAAKDLTGEFFTPDSELWLEHFPIVPVIYDHGQGAPGVVGKSVRYVRDAIGVWVEAQLDRANRYWEAVKELIDKGALAWSSGSIAHLVERERDGWLKRWPIVEMSLTPTPAEPRLTTVQAVKAHYLVIAHMSDVSAWTAFLNRNGFSLRVLCVLRGRAFVTT